MCLSILHLFTSQLLTELKNINMTLKQLQKSSASEGSKKMNYHVGWTIKRSLQLTFSCYISSSCGSFISVLLFHVPRMHLLVCSGTASCYSFKFSSDLIRDKDTSILWYSWPTMRKPTTQKKDSSFINGLMSTKLTASIPSHLRGLKSDKTFADSSRTKATHVLCSCPSSKY